MERFINEPLRFGPSHDRSAIADINTDLFPRDEFSMNPWGS
jgi:hypothetical protein